jgi:hypothetical protein
MSTISQIKDQPTKEKNFILKIHSDPNDIISKAK